MIQALVFDLDDTLYRERDFVASGYRAVARHIAVNYGCDFKSVFSTMIATLDAQGRQKVLAAVMERFLRPSVPLNELIDVYRQHSPKIRLYPGYFRLLRNMARCYRLGIITDGLPEVQKRKVRALRLECLMNKIIYTWEYGSEKQKPHPLAFSLMLDSLRAEPDSVLFVGDNPEKDCRGAHQIGMKYAQVQPSLPEKCQCKDEAGEEPEFVIDSLFQLPAILQELN